MAKHRAHNEGIIHQRPDGRWCAQVTLNGRRLTKYAKTQHECREWMKNTLTQIGEGLTMDTYSRVISPLTGGVPGIVDELARRGVTDIRQ